MYGRVYAPRALARGDKPRFRSFVWVSFADLKIGRGAVVLLGMTKKTRLALHHARALAHFAMLHLAFALAPLPLPIPSSSQATKVTKAEVLS
jgi:hypothetical protein